jgi:hypothetical protein
LEQINRILVAELVVVDYLAHNLLQEVLQEVGSLARNQLHLLEGAYSDNRTRLELQHLVLAYLALPPSSLQQAGLVCSGLSL